MHAVVRVTPAEVVGSGSSSASRRVSRSGVCARRLGGARRHPRRIDREEKLGHAVGSSGGGESEGAAENGGTASVYPLDSGGKGWDPAEMHRLTGMVWGFTTPSSTDGRKIVKHACEEANVKLKGSSNWRKEDWEIAAEASGLVFLDTFSSLAGMRGFRVVWAPHGVALLYVPGVRRFYTMDDVKAGAADDKAGKDTAGVIASLEALCRVNKSFADAYATATDPAAARMAAAALRNITPGSPEFASAMGRDPDPAGASDEYLNPRSAIARWCTGAGVDAPALYREYGVGFDFHGPAGTVSRGVIAAAAFDAGKPVDPDADVSWPKQRWVEAMESLGVTYRSTHAPLSSLGRGWKVCWIADAVGLGCPSVLIWAPEQNAYFTLGSLSAATAETAPAPVEGAIRAIVAVAKSTPAPQGLKAALTKDSDFLTLLGRKPADDTAAVSAGTTGGAAAAAAADAAAQAAGTLPTPLPADPVAPPPQANVNVSATEEVSVIASNDDDDDDDDDEVVSLGGRAAAVDPPTGTDDGSTYFREPAPLDDYEWADSREGLRRRPTSLRSESDDAEDDVWVSEDMLDRPMAAPGFEDVPGMEGFVAEERVTGQGEFFSRSAGYLSFVDGSFSKADLAREMGMDRHRDDAPVTPYDFPDKSAAIEEMERQSAGNAELDITDSEDFKELIPRGLPRDFESYHPLRLDGCDYLVAKTNDGRLDLREIMMARRRADGHFAGEAQRVDTSHLMDLTPAHYHAVPWTERGIVREEKHIPGSELTEFDTIVEKTKKVFLVWAEHALDYAHATDRRLDFTKPVIALDVDGGCTKTAVRGAEAKPKNGVLVIREGEMFVQAGDELPNWEEVCTEHDMKMAEKSQGPDLHADFLKEVEDDYIPDDTPEVDNF